MDIDDINYSDEFVLVVDDEDYIREPIVEMLRRMGFRVDSATNGKHALEKLKEKGVVGYVHKPFSPEIIRDVIYDVIGAYHANSTEKCVD